MVLDMRFALIRLLTLLFESSASANFANPAYYLCGDQPSLRIWRHLTFTVSTIPLSTNETRHSPIIMILVRSAGFEPACPKTLAPQASESTNSTTTAYKWCAKWDSNPQNTGSKPAVSTYLTTGA